MNEKWDLISKLDLNSVKAKLKEKKGWWWNFRNNISQLEAEYRQFLYLAVANPTKIIVPWSVSLDDFWHEHILDTVKYEKDCMEIFGKIFHHNPHMPVGSTSQVKAYNETKEMYKEAFEKKAKDSHAPSSDPGCGGCFVAVFCGGSCDSHSSGHSCGGHSDSSSDGGHSCGGHSCGGSSCSSCGGGD